MPTAPRLFYRLPAHVINGVGVALGITLVYITASLLGGMPAAVTASSGAVYASLADLPNPPGRTWRRVLTAVAIGCLVSLSVGVLRPYPLWLGVAVAAVGFLSTLTLAWGARAGPISFVGMMAFVFTMAGPPIHGLAALSVFVGWVALGGILYLVWAMFASVCLQPRYRTLALAAVLAAMAELLRSRAALLADDPRHFSGMTPLQLCIADESMLDGQLQTARDSLFAAPDEATARRQTALLLLAIELRDTLLLGQLDLDALGHDERSGQVRHALAASSRTMADALDVMHYTLRMGRALPIPDETGIVARLRTEADVFDRGDGRSRLMPALIERAKLMVDDLTQMRGLLCRGPASVPLQHDELQLFVSVEGWPLAALRPHATLASPVLRHAVRAAMALTTAYLIGVGLPWTSHPHWLVLSVAVVLRGSLEQTLTRRDARVTGTMAGCLLVLALSQLATPWLSTVVFLGATGLAHAFSTARYFVTAAAATVMALLQDHLSDPLGGFAVTERLADTVIGALLAWAFCYFLPSWERHGLPDLVGRLMRALDALSSQAVHLPAHRGPELDLRMARREVYDALRGIAAAAQRTRAEPKSVRVQPQAFATLLAHSHALLAHLAAVKLLLTRRGDELDRHETEAALSAAAADIRHRLAQPHAAAGNDELSLAAPPAELPPHAPAQALMPWLIRRLQMASAAASHVAQAAAALTAAATATA